jgi:hypothetical protein
MKKSLEHGYKINIDHAYWDESDREHVSNLFDECCEKIAENHRVGNFLGLWNLNKLISGIAMIEQMMAAFRDTPRFVIRGDNGVAAKLDLTRNGVYARLDALGLHPNDFTAPRATVLGLIKKSDVLAPLLKELGGSPLETSQARRVAK